MTQASAVLRDVFGFDEFRPGQKDIVDAVTQGENVLAIMPTGGGKSLCYQLPALLRDGVTIVVSPLIALMRDRPCIAFYWSWGRCADIGKYPRRK